MELEIAFNFFNFFYFVGSFQFQSIFWWKIGSKIWFLGANILLTILLVYKIANKIADKIKKI
jgi:hypothetical protein